MLPALSSFFTGKNIRKGSLLLLRHWFRQKKSWNCDYFAILLPGLVVKYCGIPSLIKNTENEQKTFLTNSQL